MSAESLQTTITKLITGDPKDGDINAGVANHLAARVWMLSKERRNGHIAAKLVPQNLKTYGYDSLPDLLVDMRALILLLKPLLGEQEWSKYFGNIPPQVLIEV